jgi:hypothetical protein
VAPIPPASCVLPDGRLLLATTHEQSTSCEGADELPATATLWTWRPDGLWRRMAACRHTADTMAVLPGGSDVIIASARRLIKLCLTTGRTWLLLEYEPASAGKPVVLPDGHVMAVHKNCHDHPIVDPDKGLPLVDEQPLVPGFRTPALVAVALTREAIRRAFVMPDGARTWLVGGFSSELTASIVATPAVADAERFDESPNVRRLYHSLCRARLDDGNRIQPPRLPSTFYHANPLWWVPSPQPA